MNIQAGQIYLARRVVFGKADYSRPFLVLQTDADRVRICFFSTKFELIESGDLTISELDPEFKDTGLSESSYLVSRATPNVLLEKLRDCKLLGFVTGSIKKRVENWWRAPLR